MNGILRVIAIGACFLQAGLAHGGGGFEATGDMNVPRSHQGAALLPDGRVLQVGGIAATGNVVGSAETYDPATGQFTATGSLADARMRPNTVALADGRVLVTGGRGGNQGDTIFASAEVYDPATGQFTPTGSMTEPRYVTAVARLDDGRVLFAGGFNFTTDTLASAELYDPVTGMFSPTGPLSAPRDPGGRAAKLADGRVLIAGGYVDSGALGTAEVYDPATGQFTLTGNLGEPRGDHAIATLADGRVLVVGGLGNTSYLAQAELYDPATGTFSPTGSLAHVRANPTATLLADGRVLVAGGNGNVTGDPNIAPAEVYDPASGTFSDVGDLITPSMGGTAVRLTDGRVLLAGGWAGVEDMPTAHAELFVAGAGDDRIFGDGFELPQVDPVLVTYDDLAESFLGTSFTHEGITYRDCNGIGGVFPDGSTFEPADVGDQFIIENATMFWNDFPDFGSTPNTLTFGTSYVVGDNLSIGALVRATMDLDVPARAASIELAYYENGPWGGIELHLDALSGDSVVDSDVLTITGGGDRDNPAVATLAVDGAVFDSLRLYATWQGQPTAPRVMIDNLQLTPLR
ncbi:MAG TPA: kelch repeat-containing protein [Dokdonella sp.]